MDVFNLAWQAAGQYRKRLVWLTVQSFLVALLEAVTLLLLFSFVSGLITKGSSASASVQIGFVSNLMSSFGSISQACLILSLASIRFVLTLSMEWQSSKLWVNIRSFMQQRMLVRHLGARLDFILSGKMGEHVHHIIDGPAFAAVFYLHLVRFLSTVIMLIILLGTLSIISPELMIFAVIVALFYGIIVKRISGTLSYEMGSRQALAVKSQTALASEGIAGIRYIKMLNGIDRWVSQFKVNAEEAAYAMQRGGFWNTVPSRTIEYLILVFFLGIVIYSLSNGRNLILDLPTLAIYFLAIIRILPSLSIIGNGRMQMMQSLPYLQKYIELDNTLLQEQNDKIVTQNIDLQNTNNIRISFIKVSFAYSNQMVLKDISFDIYPNSFVALVGQSGQGKSTILDLLVGFLKPSTGKVLLGDHSVELYDIESWRNKFAYVGQDTFLFHDTLKENIRFSNPLATDDEINEACTLAGVTDFIVTLPQGLDTVLADRGASISGGQRQRIAIARALISPAEILLLDEPTSALDPKTERLVIENIAKHKKNKIVILVTHKTELLKYAELILVLNHGKVLKALNADEAIRICQAG